MSRPNRCSAMPNLSTTSRPRRFTMRRLSGNPPVAATEAAGHAARDQTGRLARNLRGVDLALRKGTEEATKADEGIGTKG